MKQSSAWEANLFSASQEIPSILWNPKVPYSIHRCRPPFSLYQLHSLFWAYHSWGIKQALGITEDLVVIDLVCVFLEGFLTALYFKVTYCPPPSELVPHSYKCLVFLSALGRDLETLARVGYRLWRWAIICHVECITVSFLTFFFFNKFAENTQWIMDGFALGKVCARCADIDHLNLGYNFITNILFSLSLSLSLIRCISKLKFIYWYTSFLIHSASLQLMFIFTTSSHSSSTHVHTY
jgi:hypothetical protein